MRHAESTPGLMPKIAISAALIALAVTAIHLAPAPTPPYRMVDDVASDPASWEGRTVRLHGWVKPGSIVHITSDFTIFTLERRGHALRVWHTGPVTDLLRDQYEVVVTGRVERAGRAVWVASTDVFGKCASKYGGERFPVGPPRQFE